MSGDNVKEGYLECENCSGSGSNECCDCGGSGTVTDECDQGYEHEHDCSSCEGGGTVDCGECDGSGVFPDPDMVTDTGL